MRVTYRLTKEDVLRSIGVPDKEIARDLDLVFTIPPGMCGPESSGQHIHLGSNGYFEVTFEHAWAEHARLRDSSR